VLIFCQLSRFSCSRDGLGCQCFPPETFYCTSYQWPIPPRQRKMFRAAGYRTSNSSFDRVSVIRRANCRDSEHHPRLEYLTLSSSITAKISMSVASSSPYNQTSSSSTFPMERIAKLQSTVMYGLPVEMLCRGFLCPYKRGKS